jgi:hypothetical protein
MASTLIPSIHIWRYSPFCAWAHSKGVSILLYAQLVSSNLVFLGSVMYPSGLQLPSSSWFSYWLVLWNFALRNFLWFFLPMSWVNTSMPREKLDVAEVVKKISEFYGTRRKVHCSFHKGQPLVSSLRSINPYLLPITNWKICLRRN